METIYSNFQPTFVYVDEYRFSKRWVYYETNIPYSLIRYIVSGTATFKVNDESYEVKANDVFYFPYGSTLYCAAREEIVFISIRFIGNIQTPYNDMLRSLWNIGHLFHFEEDSEMKSWFEEVYKAAISRNTYRRLLTSGYLNLICAKLAQLSSTDEESIQEHAEERERMRSEFDMNTIRRRANISLQKSDPRVRALVDYLTLHPEENLTREQMADMCGVGISTLRRIFKDEMGKTIHEFIHDNKMMMAVHLLLTTTDSISDIGYRLGYETPSYFTKNFRENFGVSPHEYRKIGAGS